MSAQQPAAIEPMGVVSPSGIIEQQPVSFSPFRFSPPTPFPPSLLYPFSICASSPAKYSHHPKPLPPPFPLSSPRNPLFCDIHIIKRYSLLCRIAGTHLTDCHHSIYLNVFVFNFCFFGALAAANYTISNRSRA